MSGVLPADIWQALIEQGDYDELVKNEAVFRQFQAFLRIRAHRYGRGQLDYAAADDIAAEAAVAIYRALARRSKAARPIESALKYASRVVVSRCKKAFASSTRDRTTLQAYEKEAASSNRRKPSLVLRSSQEAFWKAIYGRLRPLEREIIDLRIRQYMTNQEAASHLGVTSDTASQRYSRALVKLRTRFTKRELETILKPP